MAHTLPETNIAMENPPNFDGIYQDFDGDFHGRTVSFREGISFFFFDMRPVKYPNLPFVKDHPT